MRKDFLTDLKKIIENPHHEQGVLMEQVRKVLLEYDIIDQNDYTSKKISDIYKEYAANHLRSNSKKQVPTGISLYDEVLGGYFWLLVIKHYHFKKDKDHSKVCCNKLFSC